VWTPFVIWVVLESKLNFTSHIDSLVVKASRMLGYKRRIGRQFRDPRSFGLIWITQASCETRTTSCI
jgi:hypothetical protein